MPARAEHLARMASSSVMRVLETASTAAQVLIIAGVCFTRSRDQPGHQPGELLTVRKTGTNRFMLPGGKLDPGEDAAHAAVREVAEELGLTLEIGDLHLLGTFDEIAANEAATRLDATIFSAALHGTPRVAREIAEMRWMPIENPPGDVAPLLARHVLPALRSASREAF